MSFADRLKELRKKAGLTQEDLGQKAGLHPPTISKLEQGIREPNWATVESLAGRAVAVDGRPGDQV